MRSELALPRPTALELAVRSSLVAAASPATSARPLVLLTGGKSGGHVFPALAVGAALEERGWRLAYAGLAESMEERLATERGIEFHRLAARPVVGRGLLDRQRALFVALRSSFAARALVRRLDAQVVVGTGGFVSAPTVVGGWLARRPVVLLELNAEPGTANRWLSRFADLAAVALEHTASSMRCRCVVTGVPVREGFAEVCDVESDTPARVLVLGGSQGAVRLNLALPSALAARSDGPELEVSHQTGGAHRDATAEAYRAAGFEPTAPGRYRKKSVSVEVEPFIDDVPAELARCQLVVSRAGANTLAELCVAGRGSVLVPLRLAGGHQEANARALAADGAAVVVEEVELHGLASILDDLLGDRARLVEMGRRARALGRPDAAARIADAVETLAGRAAS